MRQYMAWVALILATVACSLNPVEIVDSGGANPVYITVTPANTTSNNNNSGNTGSSGSGSVPTGETGRVTRVIDGDTIDVNINGETGFLCEVGNIEEMTGKALFILDDKNLPGFKKNALARAKMFDVTAVLPLYEAFYLKTIEKCLHPQNG